MNLSKTIAPLTNVSLFMELNEKLQNRGQNTPGMASFSGFSGFGKSMAAAFGATQYDAVYLEIGSAWTKKHFCEALLRELGVASPRGTIPALIEQVVGLLARNNRPLYLDEADNAIDRNLIELIRDVYRYSRVPVILIGEEMLPTKLERFERVHNRLLDMVQAQPVSKKDFSLMQQIYCPEISIGADLRDAIMNVSGGRARRVRVNMDQVKDFAAKKGLDEINMDAWKASGVELFTGASPRLRAA